MSKHANKLNTTIEKIANDIMTVDLGDLSNIGTICRGIEQILTETPDNRPIFKKLATSINQFLEQIILDECDDLDNPLDLAIGAIASLQRIQMRFDRDSSSDRPDNIDLIRELERVTHTAILEGTQWESLPQNTQSDSPPQNPSEISTPIADIPDIEPMKLETVEVDKTIFSDFASEAVEHLENAESNLLELETDAKNEEILNALFRSFHTIKGASGFLNLEDVTRVAHSVEDVLDSARKGKLSFNANISDVALASIDLLRALIEAEQTQLESGDTITPQDVSQFLIRVARVAQFPDAPEAQTASVQPVPSNNQPQPNAESNNNKKRQDQYYVRVGTDKLDILVNMIGELVISQTQVSQNPKIAACHCEKLDQDIAQLDRITRGLQEVAMSMRMVPIRSTFERMARMVRDLARKCDKKVHFEMQGEETELDKNMVEELVDPLTHMVRNAVDHGIEPNQDRIDAGKSEQGEVVLEASHKGGNIVIELRDDGKGFDRDKVLQKAVERGLAKPNDNLTDEQIYDLIFQPGFSTAEQISDVSGRGVGMDVVRRSIEKLHGKVEVQSKTGKGSTFAIHLPLTLAIIDGMVVGVGKERYIIPLTSIIRSLRPQKNDVFTVKGEGEMVKVHGALYPLVRLHRLFKVAPRNENPWQTLVILVESEGGKCCLMVDELLGIQQVVIKGLNNELRRDKKLSGCTILGDGRVGLILDVNGLIQTTTGKNNTKAIRVGEKQELAIA